MVPSPAMDVKPDDPATLDERERPPEPGPVPGAQTRDEHAPAPTVPAPASAPSGDPFEGRVLKDTYRIDRRIGGGGMGAIYQATQLALGRTVAVKVVLPASAQSREAQDRFLREARLLSQIDHPNVVTVF